MAFVFHQQTITMNEKWARRHRLSIEELLIYEHTKSWHFQHTWSHTNSQFQAYLVLIDQIWKNNFDQMSLGKISQNQHRLTYTNWRQKPKTKVKNETIRISIYITIDFEYLFCKCIKILIIVFFPWMARAFHLLVGGLRACQMQWGEVLCSRINAKFPTCRVGSDGRETNPQMEAHTCLDPPFQCAFGCSKEHSCVRACALGTSDRARCYGSWRGKTHACTRTASSQDASGSTTKNA